MRAIAGIIMIFILVYVISNPAQAFHDIQTLFNHAYPVVRETIQNLLHQLQNYLRR